LSDFIIKRTPEDASKLSHQAFWNKKIQGDARPCSGKKARLFCFPKKLFSVVDIFVFSSMTGTSATRLIFIVPKKSAKKIFKW